MLEKLKQKICQIVCIMFDITPCMCKHECDCKKKDK